MKKFAILFILVLSITNTFSQYYSVNFSLQCPGSQTACNAFYPQLTCNNVPVRTMYGAPKLMNYTWDHQGTPETNQVVKLTGTKATINGIKEDVDEGFEFQYVFKPYRNYVITVSVSGLYDNNGTNVIAAGEVIVGSQYSTQNVSGCTPDKFDFQKNNGTVVLSFTPTSYKPTSYQAVYQTTDVNMSKVKVRCRNTLNPQPPVNNSYLLVYLVQIQEGLSTDPNYNPCHDRYTYITEDIDWDFANPPHSGCPCPYYINGSYYVTTATSNLHFSNGSYTITSNNDVLLKPGFHASVGPNGLIRATIGRCSDGNPLREATNQGSNDRPQNVVDTSYYNKVTLFPNPARSELNILLKENLVINQLFVTDNLGRRIQIKMVKNTANKITVDVSALKNGVYFLSFLNKESVQTYKFIVNR